MEVYQIKVFLEVARLLSFTEAADALNLTQPAVSAKIKSLESEIGTPLFYRLGRKIQLTEVGQFLYEEGPRLIEVENQLFQKIEELKKGKHGHLRVGCTPAIGNNWLPDILFRYRQSLPGIQTNCLIFDSAELLYRAITNNQVDVGFSELSFAEFAEIFSAPIDQIEYSLFAAKNHPLVQQGWLDLKQMEQEACVLLPPSAPSHLVFEQRLAELGSNLSAFEQIETVDTLSLMRTYMLQGDYLGFASNFDFQSDIDAGQLVKISLQEFALPGSVFLLLPRRLSQLVTATVSGRRARTTNPIQKFLALLRSLHPFNLNTEQPEIQISEYINEQNRCEHRGLPSVRLRSPNLTTRSSSAHRPETITLRIGIQNSTIPTVTAGLVIQQLRLLEHFLPRDGRYSATQYQLQWCNFSTGAPIITGLHSGQLEIGVLGDYPLLLSALQPTDTAVPSHRTRLVSFVSTNPDGSCNAVIVPNESDLQTIADLRGRVIAVPFSSSAHGMVMRSLNSANLLSDVKIASLEQVDLTHLLNQSLQPADGYAHFAPFHDIACSKGNFRYLDGSNIEKLPAFHGVVVSETLAEHYPEVVIAYLKALTGAQYWYANTPSALSLVSTWTALEADMIKQILTSSHQTNQAGRFFPQMKIQTDWIEQHITQLRQVPGNEKLSAINLNRWIQPEFLEHI
ncbi:MAG: LysR family transcriptional regulator [Oscillatoriales cyanobacterium C42_A2020_001]|nr:LysR family transcriptional regulator [Leptolyngbyaceae cyanobacterium C42_A2020_001]